jgi:hypothetical protein
MKKTFSIVAALCLVSILAGIALATGFYNYGPTQIVPQNPVQPNAGYMSVSQTNTLPAVYTNIITFPYPFPSNTIPITGIVQNLSTNAANEPMTNTFTTTNLTIVSVATNTTFIAQAYMAVPRIFAGYLALGAFISGSVTYTNTFPTTYVQIPSVVVSGSGTGTNVLNVSSITTSNFVITAAGSTNQTFSWQSFGYAGLPGVNTPSN